MLTLLSRIFDRVPSWARPALFGALVLFSVVLCRALFMLPRIIRGPGQLASFAVALLAVSAAGAVGGLCYSLVGRPLLRLRRTGPYLAGIAIVGGYMLALLIAAPFISPGETLVADGVQAVIFAGCTVFFGLVFGHQLRGMRP